MWLFILLVDHHWCGCNSGDAMFGVGITFGIYLIIIIIIIIITMAGMADVLRGWLPHRVEAQMARFPTRTML